MSSRPGIPNQPHVGETWRELAAMGKNDKAYVELGPDGIASKAKGASIDDLFTLADVARLSGHAVEAVDPLQRIVTEHPSDGRASLAALTLGRIQLRSLGMSTAAARSLEKAIALGVPSGLSEDTQALLIEALSRAGERGRARAAYAEFTARFPESQKSAELSVWVREP
jgi:transmembrane sensor